jgi:Na+-transporting methylmalonyl-CoA/oxaloacetate decarboxylase gamma subunit
METVAAPIIDLQEHIQGVGGAFILTIIAFTVVFLVLGGLTAIIYGIQYLALALERKQTGGSAPAPAPSPAAPSAPAAAVGTGDGRLLAVIAGAIAAHSGGTFRISSVRPAGSALSPSGGAAWRQSAIFESLGGLSRDWK